ncbi:hypothetical protein BDM02DRAFT_930018 [Thelephora ganbajun]|uniref:Uncharacterized protein n=1 Tax=Thelephora ganbajun TaxID=370292 RepID=A0ACB6Z5I4_THEGA|nr:hypothetical protein BDM02DRAFT_930018 [Thelephora ganbajun]
MDGGSLGEGNPQPSSMTLRQGRPLFMTTNGLDPSSSSERETVANTVHSTVNDPSLVHRGSMIPDDLQRSPFHELPGTFHDHHALPRGPRGDPPETWELAYTPIAQLSRTPSIVPPHVTPMHPSNNSLGYIPLGEPSNTMQLRYSLIPHPPPQGHAAASSALDVLPPTTFHGDHMSSAVYHHNGRANAHAHESPTLLTSQLSSCGMIQDPNTNVALSHTAPRWQNDPPIAGVYPPATGRSSSAGTRNENLCGASPPLRSLGEGSGRPRAVGHPSSFTLLTSPPAELDHHDRRHTSLTSRIRLQGDAGPSGSSLTALVSSCGA